MTAAAASGIVRGTSPTTFSPDELVTREPMAVIVARALKLRGGGPLTATDSSAIDAWVMAGAEAARAAGYLMGFPDGRFQPLGTTTRAQAAQVLSLALQRPAP